MRLKEGVKLTGLAPQMIVATVIANDEWKKLAAFTVPLATDMVWTSCNDRRHSYGSKHYAGDAVDVRTKTLARDKVRRFVDTVAANCGAEFDVVLEDFNGVNEHMHMEYHPKS